MADRPTRAKEGNYIFDQSSLSGSDTRMPKKPRDLKFADAAKIDKSYRTIPAKLGHKGVRKVAEAFVANIDRMIAMVEFAPLAIGLSRNQADDTHVDNARRNSSRRAFEGSRYTETPLTLGPANVVRPVTLVDHSQPARWEQDPLPEGLRAVAVGTGTQN